MPSEIKSRSDIDFNEEFASAYDLLENSRTHLFITGRAGTGKSTLLKYFRDNTRKNVVVLAPTGAAAVNIGGQTIHSFFGFKPDITPQSVDTLKVYRSKAQMYKKIDTIIIDEISMVRSDLLDCVDTFLKLYGPDEYAPFGGVQMVFIGDLFQLPPVVTYQEKGIFDKYYKSPYFFDAKSFAQFSHSDLYNRQEIKFLELSFIYRQKDDEFIGLLNAVRGNTLDEKQINRINSRVNPDFKPDPKEFYVYLTTTNALADQINVDRLSQIKDTGYRLEGTISGTFDIKNLPTQQILDIKLGAQVMMLNNDPTGRWINGSIGKIVSIDDKAMTAIIKVELTTGRVVDVLPSKWDMYQFFYDEELERIESESVGSFAQYPLRLAWAVTIHKAQGKTFDKMVIDIGQGTFSPGQMYVALSRCTSFDGLILKRPIHPRHIMLDQRVVEFVKNLTAKSNLQDESK